MRFGFKKMAAALAAAGCLSLAFAPPPAGAAGFTLTSPAFAEGGTIPARHTCDGKNVSPLLRWADPPRGTAAFALIADDPDAPGGTWVHWVIYDLPPSTRELLTGVDRMERRMDGSRQGTNSFGRIGYGGPCPPAGPAHRYVFQLYALDALIPLPPGVTKQRLLQAMEGHVLGAARLVGRYGR